MAQFIPAPDGNYHTATANAVADYYHTLRSKGIDEKTARDLTNTYIGMIGQIAIANTQASVARTAGVPASAVTMADIRDYVSEIIKAHIEGYHNGDQ